MGIKRNRIGQPVGDKGHQLGLVEEVLDDNHIVGRGSNRGIGVGLEQRTVQLVVLENHFIYLLLIIDAGGLANTIRLIVMGVIGIARIGD